MSKTISNQFPEEREQLILEFLENQGKIRIGDVTDILGISPSTARILLQKMHDKGLLQRTHGGAISLGKTAQPNHDRNFSEITNRDKKQKIAAAAAETVQDGDYIVLGSGTTTFLMSTLLHDKRDLTVVTDSIPIAYELLNDEHITLYVCGGWIMKRNSACRGITAENFFKDLKVDKSYCSADAVDVRIGTSSVDFDPRTESAVCRSGAERYILADSTKFKIRPFIDKVLSIREINHVISDAALDESDQTALREAGVHVILAP